MRGSLQQSPPLNPLQKGLLSPSQQTDFCAGSAWDRLVAGRSEQAFRANPARLFAVVDFQGGVEQLGSRRKLSTPTLHGQALGTLLDPYFRSRICQQSLAGSPPRV